MINEKENTILQTIGITGAQKGVGVTHLSIMLSNYINAKCNKNVSILEMNQTGAFEELKKCYVTKDYIKHEQGYDSFSIAGVTYYYKVGKEMLGIIYNQCKDYLIIDFGKNNEEYTKEFIKCNIKIVVGNLNPWNKSKLIACMESFIVMDYLKKIKYVSRFGGHDDVKQIKNSYKTSIYTAPFEPDPFLIHGGNFDFLDELLKLL